MHCFSARRAPAMIGSPARQLLQPCCQLKAELPHSIPYMHDLCAYLHGNQFRNRSTGGHVIIVRRSQMCGSEQARGASCASYLRQPQLMNAAPVTTTHSQQQVMRGASHSCSCILSLHVPLASARHVALLTCPRRWQRVILMTWHPQQKRQLQKLSNSNGNIGKRCHPQLSSSCCNFWTFIASCMKFDL